MPRGVPAQLVALAGRLQQRCALGEVDRAARVVLEEVDRLADVARRPPATASRTRARPAPRPPAAARAATARRAAAPRRARRPARSTGRAGAERGVDVGRAAPRPPRRPRDPACPGRWRRCPTPSRRSSPIHTGTFSGPRASCSASAPARLRRAPRRGAARGSARWRSPSCRAVTISRRTSTAAGWGAADGVRDVRLILVYGRQVHPTGAAADPTPSMPGLTFVDSYAGADATGFASSSSSAAPRACSCRNESFDVFSSSRRTR